MKTKKNNDLLPVDLDAHFKYICPGCGVNHWVSLREAKTKGFIIVCDCYVTFSVRTISKISIEYSDTTNKHNKKVKSKNQNSIIEQKKVETKKQEQRTYAIDFLDECAKMLVGLGYTRSEVKEIIAKTKEKNTNLDSTTDFIKYAINNFGEYYD
jgi:hypothetical protein